MKKLGALCTTLVLALSMGTVTTFAQTNDPTQYTLQGNRCFVDANDNGICDNVGTGEGCRNATLFIDSDGDGVCDNIGTRNGREQVQGGRGRGCRN